MIQVENTNNQLKITRSGVVSYYPFEDFKSVNPYYGPSGDIIVINFINENRDSSLRIPLAEIDNQASWTTLSSAIEDISIWVNESTGGLLATEATLQSVVDNTTGNGRLAFVERTSTSGSNTGKVFSISFYNAGTANGIVQGAQLKPGETINFDAGAIGNYFDALEFSWDATGTDFLIIFVQ